MFRRLSKIVVVLTAAMGITLAGVGTASAAPSRSTLYTVADRVAHEVVHGPLYGKYKKAYPQLNWTHDGCSVPVWQLALVSPAVAAAAAYYKGKFVDSCNRHDFGYRNFGKNTSGPGVHLKLQPTRTRKNQIDSQFQHNMKVQCGQYFGAWYQIPQREACYKAADAFHWAVSNYGDGAFFG
jgi:hypothetical protein